ncbi:isomerase YbhE [Penicillium malachiteum]|uniref:isomerase YbhE n=1 Tax=Penicillium malachiteum TaxID=1324776 RepID=UPI002548EFA3|nr:isomerase YbhE [Penicillium malachiteum]KAJ5726242.1 isomerase YbhE [Penicillium malachiteum]
MIYSFLATNALQFLLLCDGVHGVLLYVASYLGNVTILSLTYDHFAVTSPAGSVEDGYFAGFAPAKRYNLSVVDTFRTPAKYVEWLTLNKHNNILYLTDGVTTGNGSLTAYRTSSKNGTGPPIQLDSIKTLSDGAFAGLYANGKAIAVAHYSSSALQTYDITAANGTIKPLETFTYTLDKPGGTVRQTAPFIHEARTDPLEQYLLAIDLGSDLVHIYTIDDDTLLLEERASLNFTSGSGPRHGVFSQDPIMFPDGVASYVFYLGAEIAGTITAYRVKYLPNRGGLDFKLLRTYSSLEPGKPNPYTGGKEIIAELRISPDGNFLIASNRRDATFNGTITQYPPNGTSDSMSTFRIRQDLSGKLDFVQSAPAGGSLARTFELNKAGDLAVVGLEDSDRVTILERDVASGLFKQQIAAIDISGQIWGVLWNE